jgi:hypothetical protein
VPAKKDLQSIRANDSPKQWAVWFLLFYPLAAPIYAITRRNWSVLTNTLAISFAISILWEIAKFIIKSLWSYDIDTNVVLDLLFTLTIWIGISVVGFYSVQQVVEQARGLDPASDLLDANTLSNATLKAKVSGATKQRRSVQELMPKFQPLKGRSKFIAFVFGGFFIVAFGSYAIYTTTVETTIKSNPVLAAVAATGTTIQIKHFNCGESYGYYDTGSDTLEVCTAVHDDQLFSSKESTIRHEAWHLVQACSSIENKNDPWGNLVLVDTPLLSGKTLSPVEQKYIAENYEQENHKIESEALLAETYLTDGQIIQAIEQKCNFSG